ncbi:MFS transporter [Pseudonocardia spinosispora]|uniref:MFS transporter n=1 Tax=Pseudonocardia spinosispora TaxID=103441 RepID=UPI000685DF70
MHIGSGDPTTSATSLTGPGLFTLLLGAALAPIDLFIVNVALPTIQADVRASPATLEWVVAGYGIGFALLLVIGGRLGDAFGRRRLFTVGLAAFTVTSLACGLAPNALVLVLARAAQGAAAALLVPQVLSIIQATTHGERRARTLGYYGATGGLSMVIGQLLGGVLVSADVAGLGWRPIFLVNVPIGLVAMVLAQRTLPETRASDPIGVDLLGTGLFGVSLLTLLVPLMEGQGLGWPVWCWVLLSASPFVFALFVAVELRVERRGRVPLLPPSVLRVPTMRRGLVIALPFFAGFGGFMFVYALVLQNGLHLGPLRSGLALTPLAVAFLAATLVTSRLVHRYGRRVLVAGALLLVVSLVILAGTALVGWPGLGVLELMPGTVLFGVGQGLIAPTLFRLVLSQVPAGSAGVGSGMLTTTQQTALALGVALLGSLFVGLSAPDALGFQHALLVVSGVQALVAAALAVLVLGLPDPRG